jgi:hypothetical protein
LTAIASSSDSSYGMSPACPPVSRIDNGRLSGPFVQREQFAVEPRRQLDARDRPNVLSDEHPAKERQHQPHMIDSQQLLRWAVAL